MKKSSKPNDPQRKEDLVMTPGGPRSKDKVHTVRPDEAVRMDESGKVVIEPRKGVSRDNKDSAEELVLTPGGYRPKSRVHLVEPGHVLRMAGDRVQKIHPSGKVVAEFEILAPCHRKAPLKPRRLPPKAREVPGLGTGWIACTEWKNDTGSPVTSFITSWVVPPAPATQSGQTIFLFNGMTDCIPSQPDNAPAGSWIYQPVLQWGSSYAGGGSYWSVASWHVSRPFDGHIYCTQLVQVNPGDILTGIMTMTNQSGNSFDYNCEFQGIANTSLIIQGFPELTYCCEALEAYDVQQCSDYPATAYTAFQQINIQTGTITPALNWAPVNLVTDCGQQAVVASNANPGGDVDIYYQGIPPEDLFIRDNLQDFGAEPLIGGGLSCSPDIIVFNQELLDPQATLGSPAAQNDDTLGDQVEPNQDNFLYFRVQNRGACPSASGKIYAYWANLSTWPIPGGWNPIDDQGTDIPPVNPGEFKVVGAMKWLQGDIPAAGHYCFLALIDSADDPAPDPASIQGWDDYYHFIRESNNATWKNFDVLPQLLNSYTTTNFQINGWPKKKLSSDLIIDVTALPKDFSVWLRILRRLTTGTTLENMKMIQQSDLYMRFKLNPGKVCSLKNMNLKSSDTSEASLELLIPAKAGDGYYRISVAQVVDGLEMGRVTRMIAVGQYPYVGNRRSREVHIASCDWAAKISRRNKEAYQDLERALKHGYDGCHFCLPEYSKD